MRSHLPSLLRGWRAALLLVAVACAPPQRAAECGDVVTILYAPGGSTSHAMPSPAGAGDLLVPTRPCQVPNCQAATARHFPPLALVVPTEPQGKFPAQCLEQLDDANEPGESFDGDTSSPRRIRANTPPASFDGEASSTRPVHRATSVFHPPRLG